MSAMDKTIGYPVHAVAEYRDWTNQYGARFVDWRAPDHCGASGTATGSSSSAFGRAGSARQRELCPVCWPLGHSTSHSAPIERREPIEASQ